ncbi:MAG: hypothetical protein R3B84_17265 [Zavarzinella sp.]
MPLQPADGVLNSVTKNNRSRATPLLYAQSQTPLSRPQAAWFGDFDIICHGSGAMCGSPLRGIIWQRLLNLVDRVRKCHNVLLKLTLKLAKVQVRYLWVTYNITYNTLID